MSEITEKIAREHVLVEETASGGGLTGILYTCGVVLAGLAVATHHISEVTEAAVRAEATVTPSQEDWHAAIEAERIVHHALKRLVGRVDWAEDDTAIGAQAARIVSAVLALLPGRSEAEVKAEALPVVAHKGPLDTDASMFTSAADRLDAGYPIGGSNLTDAVVRLIRREVARADLIEKEADRD